MKEIVLDNDKADRRLVITPQFSLRNIPQGTNIFLKRFNLIIDEYGFSYTSLVKNILNRVEAIKLHLVPIKVFNKFEDIRTFGISKEFMEKLHYIIGFSNYGKGLIGCRIHEDDKPFKFDFESFYNNEYNRLNYLLKGIAFELYIKEILAKDSDKELIILVDSILIEQIPNRFKYRYFLVLFSILSSIDNAYFLFNTDNKALLNYLRLDYSEDSNIIYFDPNLSQALVNNERHIPFEQFDSSENHVLYSLVERKWGE